MKDGHYSRPVWADDGWLAKYAGKTLDEDNVGADGGVSAEYVPGATATIGKMAFILGVGSYSSDTRGPIWMKLWVCIELVLKLCIVTFLTSG